MAMVPHGDSAHSTMAIGSSVQSCVFGSRPGARTGEHVRKASPSVLRPVSLVPAFRMRGHAALRLSLHESLAPPAEEAS